MWRISISLLAICLAAGCGSNPEQRVAFHLKNDPRLPEAAFGNDFPGVKTALGSDVDVDSADIEDKTALYYSAINNNVKMAEFLIEHGANVDRGVKSKVGDGPLHAAASHQSCGVAALLLQSGADPNLRGGGGVTPLHRASWDGSYAVAVLLVSHGADVNALTGNHESVLHMELMRKDILLPEVVYEAIVQYLISHGANPSTKDADGHTAGERARLMGYVKVADMLDGEERRLKADGHSAQPGK